MEVGETGFDVETEALTRRGWQNHESVSSLDALLTIHTSSGFAEWQPVLEVRRGPHEGLALSMSGFSHSSLSGPSAVWPVEVRKKGRPDEFEWRSSRSLNSRCHIKTAAPLRHETINPYQDAFVELVAWYWTEGTRQGNSVRIYQSRSANPTYCSRIELALRTVFGSPGKVSEGGLWYCSELPSGINHYNLCVAAARQLYAAVPLKDKVLDPAFLASLNEDQLELFIRTSIAADGTVGTRTTATSMAQASEERTRMFEMACALKGIPTSTNFSPQLNVWRTTLVRRGDRRVNPHAANLRADTSKRRCAVAWVPHSGIMWVPVTTNRTWLARRSGSVFYAGCPD